MSVLVTKGIVLRYANYRETSRILTLFSRDMGVLTVSAKGCLRPKCRERAATELYTLGEYTLSERAGRYYLNTASIEDSFFNLRLDIDRLALASYFADLCRSVLNEGDPQPELFDLLAAGLSALCREGTPLECARLVFEGRLMDLLGFRPEVECCAACGRKPEGKLFFSIEAGGIVCEACRGQVQDCQPMLPGTAVLLRQAMAWDMDRLHVLKPGTAVLNDLDKTFRPFVAWHLERTYKLDGFMGKLRALGGQTNGHMRGSPAMNNQTGGSTE